ncbi:MAG: hypothetical protein GTO54_06150, partial [Nitrososphaeria archaeon]|nr:hypothetical protein [Nitrososphaeria archaeon]NIN52444.1 hypothetical protein [Nitrososphaeria archaeon]
MRRYLHILISLILLASPLWASLRPTLAQTDWQYSERIDFYFAGESGLWIVNLTGGNITFFDLDHSAYPYNLIERLELTLFYQDTWNETFNFFRDDVLYDTRLPEFTADSATLSLKISEAVTPDAARKAVGEISTALSDGLYLALTDTRELSGNTFELVSPISPTQHFKKIWGMFPTSLEGFLDSVSPSTLLNKKAAYVSVTTSKKGIYYENSIVIGLLEPNLVSNGQFRLEDSIPQVEEMRSSPYSNSSVINLHLRNAYMAEFPEDVSVTHSPVEDLTIIKKELKSNETIPNLVFTYKYSYPILIAVREPSSFLITPDQTLNVTLRVTNIGENMAEDVKITEVEWWDPSDFELIKGDLTAQFPTIRKDQTKTISYSLNSLYTGKVKTITIPPYEVTHPSKEEGGRPIYTTYSNSQVLWLGGASAPTLIARIIDVSDPSPTVEDDLTYYIQIFNEGTAPAEHVMIEERIIGLLEPGDSETVLMRTRPVDDTDTRKTLHSQVSFSYQGEKHYVESPMFDVYFTPTASLGPSLNVNRRVSLAHEGEKEMNLTVSINLTNIGRGLVDRIMMNNRLPKEASYVEGNVSYNPQKHEVTYTGVDLVEGESLLFEYRVLVESESSVIFPEATFRCFKGDQFLSYRSEVNSHVDSIKLKR